MVIPADMVMDRGRERPDLGLDFEDGAVMSLAGSFLPASSPAAWVSMETSGRLLDRACWPYARLATIRHGILCFSLQRDQCGRITGYTLGRPECDPNDCDRCRLNSTNIEKISATRMMTVGNEPGESHVVRRHIDWSHTITIQHTYDQQGLRIQTTGYDLPEEDAPARGLYLHDEWGRLIRRGRR